MNERKLLMQLIIFTSLCGVMGTFIKLIMTSVPATFFLGFRYLLAGVILLTMRFGHIKKHLKKGDIRAIGVIGFFFTLGFLVYNFAILYTTITNATFYYSTTVLMIPFLAKWINGTDYNKKLFLGIGITLVGMFLLMRGESGELSLNKGDILALLSAVLFALHVIATGRFIRWSDPVIITTGQFFVLAVVALSISCFMGEFSEIASISAMSWIGLASMACVGVCMYLTQGFAQRVLPETTIGIVYATMPLFTAFSAWPILGETLNGEQIVGCALMIVGVMCAAKLNRIPARVRK